MSDRASASAVDQEEKRLLAMAADAKVGFGASNPRLFVRSLLSALPHLSHLSQQSHSLSHNLSDSDLSLDDSYGNDAEQVDNDISGSNTQDSATPSLSLPESFDRPYEYSPVLRKPQAFAAVTAQAASTATTPQFCNRCTDSAQLLYKDRDVWLKRCHSTRDSLELTKAELQRRDEEVLVLKNQLRLSGIASENLKLEVAGLGDRATRLQQTLDGEVALRKDYESRATQLNSVIEEANRLRAENLELKRVSEQQSDLVKALSNSEQEARNALRDSERIKEMLQMDKTFLQQEQRSLESRLNEQQREREHSVSKALALEVKLGQLTDQLLSLQLNARNGFDERMDKEITRLKEESLREMEYIRNASREITDRENRVLREAKEGLENECAHLRRRNDSLSLELSQLQREMANTANEKNEELSQLRGELKMKVFELTSLGVSYEERMGQLRQTQLESDVLRQEVLTHKSALMRLEHDGVSTQLSLQSDLDKAMHKLRTYEALEEEVDSAIMRTAQSDPSADTDSMTQQLLKSVRNIPVNPERRVRQAVFLAQKLLESDRQREEAERRCQKCEGELRVAKEQLAIARENLSRAAQPTQYLVSKLRDEEAAKIAFLKKVDQLSAELIACQQTLNDSTVDNANLRERLQSVLEQREELETVRIVLEKLRMDAMAAEDDDSVEGEYGDTPHGESNNLLMHAESHRFGEEEHKQHQNTAHSPHGKTNLDAMSQKFNLSAEKLRWMTSPPSSSPRK